MYSVRIGQLDTPREMKVATTVATSTPHCIAVLVVEDEPITRMNLVEELEGAGIETLEASNADDAIEILVDRTDICVVVTDIEMPGSIDGLGLARMVQDRWPPIHVIVASGRYFPELGDLPERYNFFAKPYDVPHLMSVIKAHVP